MCKAHIPTSLLIVACILFGVAASAKAQTANNRAFDAERFGTFTLDNYAAADSSLQINGGNQDVGGGNPTLSKRVDLKGSIYRGGTLQGAPWGSIHGPIYTYGDIHSLGAILVKGPHITLGVVDNRPVTQVIDDTTLLHGNADLTKQGSGSDHIGPAINAGTTSIIQRPLLNGANNQLNDDTKIITQHATLTSDGYKETVGTLTLNNSAIDTAFANKSGSYTLPDSNYLDSTKAINYGDNTTGLNTSKLAQVNGRDPVGAGSGLEQGAIIDSNYRIRTPLKAKPVPELNSSFAFALLALGAAWNQKKKIIPFLATIKVAKIFSH